MSLYIGGLSDSIVSTYIYKYVNNLGVNKKQKLVDTKHTWLRNMNNHPTDVLYVHISYMWLNSAVWEDGRLAVSNQV